MLDVGTYLIALLFLFVYSATPNDSILLAGLAVSWAYGLLVTYLIWSRSLATRRGTLGMRQMGLSIRSASRQPAISKGQAFRRSIIALLPFVFASGAGWLLLYTPDDDLIENTELPAWQKVQDVNLKSVYLCCRAALRHMVPAGRQE